LGNTLYQARQSIFLTSEIGGKVYGLGWESDLSSGAPTDFHYSEEQFFLNLQKMIPIVGTDDWSTVECSAGRFRISITTRRICSEVVS
jgi:hypothetical protein